MKREEAINNILDEIGDALVISTTGKISRELYELRIKRGEEPNDFYMMGSMGHALPIGIGVALSTDKEVVVLDGDGAILMQMGAVSTVKHYGLHKKNLRHYVLNNEAYDSTGGQPTTFLPELLPNTETIFVEKGCRDDLGRIPIPPKQIVKNFYEKARH